MRISDIKILQMKLMEKLKYTLLVKIVSIVSLVLLCHACVKVDDSEFDYTIAVEGWIDEGDVPYVILTKTIPIFSTLDSLAISEMVIRWAKVSVSDGETTEILTGRIDKDYFPPFVYRGTYMMGEAGKTYKLKVEYSGRVWEAETTIPKSVPLVEITSQNVSESDTLKTVEALFVDPVGEKNYYRFYTKTKREGACYIGSLMGNLDDNVFDGKEVKTTVFKGLSISQNNSFNPYFHINDTVYVKFTTTSEFGFRYWTAYENELINSQNPFLPANKNLPSNISDGKGIWCGYGKRGYVVLPK